MVKAVLFDLDGTLLPNDEKLFGKLYFTSFAKKMAEHGYDPETFVNGMMYAAKMMIDNDGSKTNLEAFKEGFIKATGRDIIKDEDIVNDYYENEYKSCLEALDKDNDALECVKECKRKGLIVILASNPLFPKIAYNNRMIYNDLLESYFDEITSYDLYHFAKPNPNYYKEILSRHNLKPEEAIFFGNEPELDIIGASKAGIKSYLVHGKDGISSKEMLNIIKNI